MEKLAKSFVGQFRGWSKFEKFLGMLAILGSIALTLLWGDTLFGLSVTLTGILGVILVNKRSQWNYLWGTYNVIGYAYLAWTYGLGGDFMLNALYFLPMQFVGYKMWSKNIESGATVKAKDFGLNGYINLILFSATAIFLYGVALQNYIAPALNSLNLPVTFPIYESVGLYFFDSMSTVLSVIAMWLMVKRYAAQWFLWLLINVASIAMWSIVLVQDPSNTNAIAMLIMWSIYLLNSAAGFINWRKAIN